MPTEAKFTTYAINIVNKVQKYCKEILEKQQPVIQQRFKHSRVAMLSGKFNYRLQDYFLSETEILFRAHFFYTCICLIHLSRMHFFIHLIRMHFFCTFDQGTLAILREGVALCGNSISWLSPILYSTPLCWYNHTCQSGIYQAFWHTKIFSQLLVFVYLLFGTLYLEWCIWHLRA